MAAVDVVVGQAEALASRTRTRPGAALGRQRREQRRAARASAGRSRAASSPWRRRRCTPSSASASVGDDARARQHVGRAAGHRDRLRRAAARRRSAARTSTRSEKPITFIARAAAPTLPAWLVPTGRSGSGRGSSWLRPRKIATVILQPPLRRRAAALAPARPRTTPSHVASAAPHAQHRHQGGARGRGDHQPGLARPRPAEGQHQGAERLRHRGRPRRRGGDHRHAARRLSRPRHPGRGVGPRARREATASTSGSSTRSTAPPTSSTACRSTRCRSRLALPRPGAAGGRLRPGAQRPVLRLARAAAPSSTTSGCASPSARAWPMR